MGNFTASRAWKTWPSSNGLSGQQAHSNLTYPEAQADQGNRKTDENGEPGRVREPRERDEQDEPDRDTHSRDEIGVGLREPMGVRFLLY